MMTVDGADLIGGRPEEGDSRFLWGKTCIVPIGKVISPRSSPE